MAPALVFDLDGTLVSSMEDLTRTLNVVLDRAGYGMVPVEDMRSMVGQGAKVLLQRGLEANGVAWTENMLAPLYAEFLSSYAAHIADHTRPFPGVIAALERFAADGWRLAVCTNKTERLAIRLLEELKMHHHFHSVVGGDTFDTKKPEAEPILGAIAMAGAVQDGSVMIGDSIADINGAKAAGIPVIAVDFGYTPVPVSELGPDRIISHFDELAGALESLGLRAPVAPVS
ncbi:phosphoglycolate phosphatase [Roseibium hamelinense]|uniref:Phosphoglycolate phosphatase n=1 Tax=Roseibium hamelinense TaxID=150831 RepID=A0A562T7X1_9HYPH|nr:HAD-IA family hydrolase [Roseibium hamelinense]TWI89652.1 phosphoglycolate phosphatase [Roseibium hamelinense]